MSILPIESSIVTHLGVELTRNELMSVARGEYPGAIRIDAACFTCGEEDEFDVEFWLAEEMVFHVCYNRRTTCTSFSYVPRYSWEFDRLVKWAEGQGTDYSI